MAKHNDDIPCPSCEQKLKQADARLGKWFNKVKALFPHIHISCSYRGQLDQDKAFDEGRSRLKYPLSRHNHVDVNGRPRALALDLFVLTEEGIASFPPQLMAKIANEQMPGSMRWGGKFDFVDAVHFELLDTESV